MRVEADHAGSVPPEHEGHQVKLALSILSQDGPMSPALSARRAQGTPAALHALDVLDSPGTVWSMTPSSAAVVLGSAQKRESVDDDAADRLGLPLERRRSGGGLVVVRPGAGLWIDIVIGRDDPRWVDDVSVAAAWVGATWVEALSASGVSASVFAGPTIEPDLGRVVCFAGIGVGEVVRNGRKLVGISQRRDRRGARVQCVVHTAFDAVETASIVADPAQRAAIASRLEQAVATLSPDQAATAVGALTEQLT